MLQSSQQLGDGVNQLETLSSNYAYSHTHETDMFVTCFSIQPGVRSGGGGLSPAWPATRRIYSGELWDRWPAGGLCSRADRISSSDPRGLDGSVSQPAHAFTLTLPPGPVSVSELTAALLLLLLISQQQKDICLSFFSALSLFHLRFSLFIFFLALFQAPSDFLLTAARSDCRDIAGAKRLIGVWVRRRLSLILFQVCRQTAQRLHFSI